MGIEIATPGEEAIPYVVYDLSIMDMEQRKAKAMHFPSASKLANYLGTDRRQINKQRQIGVKTYAPRINKTVAIRIDKVPKAI